MQSMLVAALLTVAAPAAPAVSPAHLPAAMDALLAAGDYDGLARVIGGASTPQELMSDLDWLRAKMLAGESAYVSMMYARMLWDSSADLPAARQHGLRNTAAFAILYAHATITVDGARCDDPSAPGHKEAVLGMMIPGLPKFIAALSPAERKALAERVWMIERDTAARRDAQGDVRFLCGGGMNEMAHNLDHGTSRNLPDAPGGFKRIEVSGDGSYKPLERPAAEWQALVARRRADLPKMMTDLVEGLARPSAE